MPGVRQTSIFVLLGTSFLDFQLVVLTRTVQSASKPSEARCLPFSQPWTSGLFQILQFFPGKPQRSPPKPRIADAQLDIRRIAARILFFVFEFALPM